MTTNLSSDVPEPALVDVHYVCRAYLGGSSARHAYRLADAGLMPWGVKLGALRRWRKDELEAWVAGGCRPVAAGKAETDSAAAADGRAHP